jgi:hypothetical protein
MRRQQVAEVRHWLENDRRLKALEALCELNHDLLRADRVGPRRRGKNRD